VSEFEQAREAFRRKWGFDPSPVIEDALRRGEFDLEGGTEDERAFIREVLTGCGSGCGYCIGERSQCTCESDCGARPEDAGHHCPRAEGYVDWLRGTGLYSEAELARLAEGGAR
jgi:hypothetical protein